MKHCLKAYIILIVLTIPISINAKSQDFITVKVERDSSLVDLIRSSGYELDDKKITPFLEEFIGLNEGIKSIRLIQKGAVIKIPTKYLKTRTRPAIKAVKREPRKAKPSDTIEENNMLLLNIKKLFDQLGEVISVKSGKTMVFPVTERASISIDTDYFPLLELSNNRLILIDLKKRLHDDIKDIIEIYWPEYTVVSSRDFKGIVNQVLESIDYSCLDDGRVIIGDEMQVEIKADCIIMNKDKDIMENDITILSIIKENEFGLPEKFLKWAKDSGIRIIDITMKKQPEFHKEARFLNLPEQKEKLIEGLLNFLGYETKRNVGLVLNDGRNYKLSLSADIALKFGKRTKLIDLSGLPQHVINILKRHGIDMMRIELGEDSKEIILDILDFLSINYEKRPEVVSSMITPEKAKYRIKAPGIIVKSKRGNLLLSDYHNVELLRGIISNKLTLIKYN